MPPVPVPQLSLRERVNARRRALPDFVILGAQRGGTTSLYDYLCQHPDVLPATRKEVHFFDVGWELGTTWYRSHFPLRSELRGGRITGEATPRLLFDPRAPERVRRVLPKARFVTLLRDPVTRAHSNYWNARRLGHETQPTFEAALDATAEREAPGYYLTRGLYAEQLERWGAAVGRERLLVVASEELFADPSRVANDAAAWLGLAPFTLTRPYKLNSSPPETPLRPDTEQRLRAFFEPHNRRLTELLGRDLGWLGLSDRAG